MESTGRIQQRYNELSEQYQHLAKQYNTQSKNISRKLTQSGWTRVLVFIGLVAAPIYLYNYSITATIVVFIALAINFGLLVKRSISLKKKKAESNSLEHLNLNEINAQNRDWSAFENGEEFIDPKHNFSHDLDLFGEGSFFQYINRTSTLEGTIALKTKLTNPLLSTEKILEEQACLKELSSKLNFRQLFYAKGKSLNETQEDLNKLKGFNNYNPFIGTKGIIFRSMMFGLPLAFFASLGFTFLGLPVGIPSLLFFLNLGIIGSHLKALNKINHRFSSLTGILQKYATLTDLVSNEQFTSEKLLQLQKQVSGENKKASEVIHKLSHHMAQFDQRNGMLAGVILNGILLWDLHCVSKIENWLKSYSTDMENWIDTVHEMDALNSMAGFVYNHPDFTFPSTDGNTILKAKQLGHPLLDKSERICNNYDFGNSIFSLITGANMSGKSTFLRTVGLNLVLARCGMTVCSEEMRFNPMKLITNMRTTDSLMKHESYFYAELKRLKYIIEQLKQGGNVFIILDEILKGTNSKDKTYGSMELIKHLLSLNAYGMIATHDLELGVLENETKGKIVNRCFEVENRNNKLYFDYKLQSGVTQNHNATYLMKQMGIIKNG